MHKRDRQGNAPFGEPSVTSPPEQSLQTLQGRRADPLPDPLHLLAGAFHVGLHQQAHGVRATAG
jgi:hypothetical protein